MTITEQMYKDITYNDVQSMAIAPELVKGICSVVEGHGLSDELIAKIMLRVMKVLVVGVAIGINTYKPSEN